MSGGPTPRYEPRVTAGEHVMSTDAIRNWVFDNFVDVDPPNRTLIWGSSVKRPGEDWEYYGNPRRRAGWYPRKPRGARP